MNKTAGGVANMMRPLIGKPAQMAGQGLEHGMEGSPSLAGEPGQLSAVTARNKFSEDFVNDVHGIIKSNAKNKAELISNALEKNQLAPHEAVQALAQHYLQPENAKLPNAIDQQEFEELKNIILTHLEGPKKTQTIRRYVNPELRSVPNAEPQSVQPEQFPFGDPNRELTATEPINLQPVPPPPPAGPASGLPAVIPTAPTQPGALVPEEAITGEASRMQPPPPESPVGLAGHEAIHKATIDPEDDEARALFQHKIDEKLADEEALGKNSNNNPVQIEEKQLPNGKVRLIAKRAIQEEAPDEFSEQAKNIAQKQRESIRLQALLDKQAEEASKMQAQQEAARLQPEFHDETITTRAGANLSNPAELQSLKTELEKKAGNTGGLGPQAGQFTSNEVSNMSRSMARDIAQMIKMTIPETVPVDQKLHAFNNVMESLGINTDTLNLPGGEGQKARQDAMNKILKVLNPDATTDKGQASQRTIDYVKNQLNNAEPGKGDIFSQEAAKHAKTAGTIEELNQPETIGGGGPVLSAMRRGINKAAYGTGHAIGEEINKMKPSIEKAKQIFQNYTPEALQQAGARAAQSSNQTVQKLGQVLSKLATADDRTRNSMMFILEQQAGYREMMAPYFQKNEPGTPQAKDKTSEKYK